MADTLELFGKEFTNVTGLKATDNNGNILTYVRPQGSLSITENGNNIDVSQYATANVNVSGGTSTIIDQFNVSGSGTFNAPTGHAYSPVVVPSGSTTPASSISGTSATVSTGTNTITLTKSVSSTPQVSAGYISSGTSGSSSVSLSASVTTKGYHHTEYIKPDDLKRNVSDWNSNDKRRC